MHQLQEEHVAKEIAERQRRQEQTQQKIERYKKIIRDTQSQK
ncbi:MAG: hypothetical protein NUV98_06110 [Candidatus Roizmanbacteria bacterium]|nr:hypothetical protein [Candidatus Roizmanbacteria bacterium]